MASFLLKSQMQIASGTKKNDFALFASGLKTTKKAWKHQAL